MELFVRADETFAKSPQGSDPFILISSFVIEYFRKKIMSKSFFTIKIIVSSTDVLI